MGVLPRSLRTRRTLTSSTASGKNLKLGLHDYAQNRSEFTEFLRFFSIKSTEEQTSPQGKFVVSFRFLRLLHNIFSIQITSPACPRSGNRSTTSLASRSTPSKTCPREEGLLCPAPRRPSPSSKDTIARSSSVPRRMVSNSEELEEKGENFEGELFPFVAVASQG